MPRNSGRSGLTTTWPIRRSPSDRSEFRCALFPPIFDLICVTFSCAIGPFPLGPGPGRGRARPQHGRGHLLGLAVPDAYHPVAVAHHHEGGEAEAAAALDDLGHPVDGNHMLQIGGLLVGRAAAPVLTALAPLAAAAAPRCSWH